jgi:hypothetical protein
LNESIEYILELLCSCSRNRPNWYLNEILRSGALISIRRERVPPREEDEERYGSSFDEEEDRDSIVNNRRPGGRFKQVRNRDDNNLGGIKMKIPSFQGRSNPEAY